MAPRSYHGIPHVWYISFYSIWILKNIKWPLADILNKKTQLVLLRMRTLCQSFQNLWQTTYHDFCRCRCNITHCCCPDKLMKPFPTSTCQFVASKSSYSRYALCCCYYYFITTVYCFFYTLPQRFLSHQHLMTATWSIVWCLHRTRNCRFWRYGHRRWCLGGLLGWCW
jgi:hypothetical protein